MKGVLEERAVELGVYILENKATVRAAAKEFDISKSTVHMDVTNWNGKSPNKIRLLCKKRRYATPRIGSGIPPFSPACIPSSFALGKIVL